MGSSISMGAVAIFSMHYIGNQAVVLYQGQPDYQLAYNAGYTVLSLFLPVMVLLLAYALIGAGDQATLWRVIIGGTFGGFAIAGMHYLGQLSVINYTSVYTVGNVVGSVIIAVVATIIALTVFFYLRRSWSDALWKRFGCALILAGAVCGMHWTAAVGTRYYPTPLSYLTSPAQRNSAVIAVAVVSFSACLLLLGLSFWAARRASRAKTRAEKVVLASVVFDTEGRIMLTVDGTLPSQEITDKYHERSFEESFDINHPVFQWIYRATFNWETISSLVPTMRNNLRYQQYGSADVDYATIFREMFSLAANNLATAMHLPLTGLGVAFDQILRTGTHEKKKRRLGQRKYVAESQSSDESSNSIFSAKGQFILLVKHATSSETSHFQAIGYRFAELSIALPVLSRNLRIDRGYIQTQFERMKLYKGPQPYLTQGVHLGLFAAAASISSGFRIVVSRVHSDRMPTVPLLEEELTIDQTELLTQYTNRSVGSILRELRQPPPPMMEYDQVTFRSRLHSVITSMAGNIQESWFNDAVLTPTKIVVAAKPSALKTVRGQINDAVATIILLRLILPIHKSISADRGDYAFSPLSLFRIQQLILLGDPAKVSFAQRAMRQFEGSAELGGPKDHFPSTVSLSSSSSSNLFKTKFSWFNKANTRPKSDIEKQDGGDIPLETRNGIVVTNAVSVSVEDGLVDGWKGNTHDAGVVSGRSVPMKDVEDFMWVDLLIRGLDKSD